MNFRCFFCHLLNVYTNKKALAIRLKTLGENHIDTAASKANLGLLCQDLQRYDEAQTLMQSALETTQHTLGPDHVDVAGCWRNLAGDFMISCSI